MKPYTETERIELKRELNDSYKKEIVALANTDGGFLYVGIDDDGTVVGLKHPEKDLETISNGIRDAIRPDATFITSARIIIIDGKSVIEVEVLKGVKRPYHLRSKGMRPSGVFTRHGTTSNPASEDAIRQMIIESDGTNFENARSINQDLTFAYTTRSFSDKGLGFSPSNQRTLKVTTDDGYYTNLGLLLSDQCTHSIKCAVYRGRTKLDFLDRKEFTGSLLKQLDEAFAYLQLLNKSESQFVGLNRIDQDDYPYYALREALVNSVVHRDYHFRGSTLIHIFNDRIEFVSLGGLVSGITIEDIMYGVSECRNQNLANCFYRLKLIESYGTGIQRIFESYSSYPAKPELKVSENAFVVTLPNTNASDAKPDLNHPSKEESILAMLKAQKTMSRQEIETALGISKSATTSILNELLDKNRIKKIGQAKNTRYCLSE